MGCSVAQPVCLSSYLTTTWSAQTLAIRGLVCFLLSVASGLPLRYREITSQMRWMKQRGLGGAMEELSSQGSSQVW